MNDILNLTEEDIKNLKFSDLVMYLEKINQYFQNSKDNIDIDYALKIYKKALDILVTARQKLTLAKEEKKKIDEVYENIKKNLEIDS